MSPSDQKRAVRDQAAQAHDERERESLQRFVADSVHSSVVITREPALATRADALVAPSARGMTGPQRLEVYREQFWLRHLASLDEDFPTLTWVLGGREAFRALAAAYLRACPPRSWDLQRLGADLPEYLLRHPAAEEDALARDAARLDWAFMEAFDAPDSPPFDPRVLAATPEDAWPGARLELHASLRLLALSHPVHELRRAAQQGTPGERPAPALTHLVVYRDPACFLRAVSVEAPAFDLLERLRGGAPLGEACEAAALAAALPVDAIGERLGGWFQEWTASAWIRAVRLEP